MLLRKFLLAALCFVALGIQTQSAWSADDGSMSVQVKQSPVRTAPSFMARTKTGVMHS